MNIKLFLKNEQSTNLLGLIFTKILNSHKEGLVVSLKGEMGSGKTTLVRAIIKELGHVGSVPSPTYTLIEPYNLSNKPIYHIDLYRIEEDLELEIIGWNDFEINSLIFIEWPERVHRVYKSSDIMIDFDLDIEGRKVKIKSMSSKGASLIKNIESEINLQKNIIIL